MDPTWLAVVLLGLPVVLVVTYLALAQRERVTNTLQLFTVLPHVPPAGARDRVLIVVPHPDDEVLMAGGYGREALAAGARVDVLMMTMGDGFYLGAAGHYRRPRISARGYLGFGDLRRQEVEESMEVWADGRAHLHFVGLPDRGLVRMWEHHWDQDYRSPFTRAHRVPYRNVLWPRLAYNCTAVTQALAAFIKELRPTTIILPHPLDAHGDHWATGAMVDHVLAVMESQGSFSAAWTQPRRLYCVVHRGTRWPQPMGYYPFLPLRPPATLVDLSQWLAYPLRQSSIDIKEQALEAHASQLMLLREFLMTFVRRNELFTELGPMPLGADPLIISHMDPAIRDPGGTGDVEVTLPRRDTMAKDIQKMADIESLRVRLEGASLSLTVETLRPASQRVVFQLEAHLVGSNRTTEAAPLVIAFQPPRRVRIRRQPHGLQLDSADLSLQRTDRHWQLSIPLEAVGTPTHIMFTVKTRTRYGQLVDRTGWTTLVIQ